jgi:hypothetical protein
LRWARPLRGRRADILAWLRAEENGVGAPSSFASEKNEADAGEDEHVEEFEEF